jgi:cysteine-rich repeat protein
MKRVLRSCHYVFVVLAMLSFVPLAWADPQNPGHFAEPVKACRVLLPQNAATTPIGAAGQSWHDICRVSLYMTGSPPAHFNPEAQYANIPPCSGNAGAAWPRCVDCDVTPCVDPDKGYRYPHTANVDYSSLEHQDPAVDWWSVCANADLSQIVSVPTVKGCGSGNGLQEVGQCRASAAYFEKLNRASDFPAETFYSFLFTHPDCTQCGHDPLSVVSACKERCIHYFGNIGFDQEATANGVHGLWRDGSDPAWPTAVGKRYCDVALSRRQVSFNNPDVVKTPLQACVDFCGPPTNSCPIPIMACAPSGCTCQPGSCSPNAQSPPWVSHNNPNHRSPEEKNNQWYWTTYGRGRDANDTLSGWLRSYAVNTDHSSPTPECFSVINRYCNEIIPTGTPQRDLKRVQCKKTLLPPGADLDGDGNDDGAILLGVNAPANRQWNLALDGFCNAFSHAHLFCRDFCYDAGGNGELTTHVCGFDTTDFNLAGLPGSHCDDGSALCQCDNGAGTDVPCIDICGEQLNPPSPDLECDDGDVLDGDCCSAACSLEPGCP